MGPASHCNIPVLSVPIRRGFAFVALGLFMLATGCGSKTTGISNPTTPESTTIVVMLSSTGNDKLAQFNLQVAGLSLTNQAGKTVTVFASQPASDYPEFTHLNGFPEPYVTAQVPQDTYISASVTINAAQFTCVTLDSEGGVDNSTYAYGQTPANQVSVTLPQPITVSTDAMAISLDLLAAQSVNFGSCEPMGIATYSINPTFTLSALPFGEPDNALANGQATTVSGLIGAVDASAKTFTVSSPNGPTWRVSTQANTVYQGTSGFTELLAGTPVDLAIVFSTDGSIEAQRVEVLDASPTNLSIITGPLEEVASTIPALEMNGTLDQGFLYKNAAINGTQDFSFGKATFQTSGYLTNLAKMPFKPSFTAANMTSGQNILITSHSTSLQGGPTYVAASTVTLMPQTVDGIVTSVVTTGDVTAYTISLASYDLFTELSVQAGQVTQIANPTTLIAYVAGGNTGVQDITIGSPFEFTGLVFNDSGALKMDCLQIEDGVAF